MEERKIAILPPPTSPDNSPTFIKTDDNVLNITDYTDKTFIVFGEATKTYKQQMKDLGGKFNGRLKERPGFEGGPAWLFQVRYKPEVYEFVNRVNKHEFNHHQGPTHQDNGLIGQQGNSPTSPKHGNNLGLPTVIAPIKSATYQTVHWKVYKPTEGMSVTIKAGGNSTVGEVLQTESHNNIVDTVYVGIGGNTSKLVICNGQWQVWGYMVEHTIFFNKLEVQAHEIKKKEYNYEDIAGI